MNFCTKCGYKRTESAAFCTNCGNAFAEGQQGSPHPPPINYTGYYQQPVYHTKPADFPYGSQNIEKPKRSLYDKIYRSMGGLLLITLLSVALFIPITILTCNFIEDILPALLLIFSSIVVITMTIVTPIIVVHSKLVRSAVLKERVVIRNKEQFETYVPMRGGGTYIISQSFTFEFPDGAQKNIILRSKHMCASGMFDLSIAGDSGALVYQELNGKTRLIDFENDNITNIGKQRLGVYDKIYNTQGGHLFSVLTTTFSSIILYFGLSYVFWTLYTSDYSGYSYISIVLIILSILFPVVIIGFLHLPRLFVRFALKRKPQKQLQVREKQERVKLLDKGHYGKHANDFTRRVLVFEFPDKSRKSFQVESNDIYDHVVVNDTGTLTYKECKGETMLISFERDK